MVSEVAVTMMNQGYHYDVNPGWLGAIGTKYGVAEREELYRAEMIDAIVDERLKREKKKRKNDDEMD